MLNRGRLCPDRVDVRPTKATKEVVPVAATHEGHPRSEPNVMATGTEGARPSKRNVTQLVAGDQCAVSRIDSGRFQSHRRQRRTGGGVSRDQGRHRFRPCKISGQSCVLLCGRSSGCQQSRLHRRVRVGGYDGIHVGNGGRWIALGPKQIKRASGAPQGHRVRHESRPELPGRKPC